MIFLVLTVLLLVTVILTDYIKRRHFYNSLYAHMEQLDQKYLVMDTLEEPGFYEESWSMRRYMRSTNP